MKLPLSEVLGPFIKPHFGKARSYCKHPLLAYSNIYVYCYGLLGLLISSYHLRHTFGKFPNNVGYKKMEDESQDFDHQAMVAHDLKIIATSMSTVQYFCLIIGCLTENPSLFIPHLCGQLAAILIKLVNVLLLVRRLTSVYTLALMLQKIIAIAVMGFNWSQEFCVFRQCLCICDL